MIVLIVGAGGYIGGAVASALQAQGARVLALARSAEAAARLEAAGITPVAGALSDFGAVMAQAKSADAVVYAAPASPAEPGVLAHLIDAMAGSERGLIFTSGTGVLASDDRGEPSERVHAERDAFVPHRYVAERIEAERLVLAAARHGVRGVVVRPPIVYGHGGSSVIPAAIEIAGRTGRSIYVGRGENRWGHVHIDDLADLYTRAVARAAPGQTCHTVGGEATWRQIASAVGALTGTPALSVASAEADQVFGKMRSRLVIGGNSRTSSEETSESLGWVPQRTDMLADIVAGSYRPAA